MAFSMRIVRMFVRASGLLVTLVGLIWFLMVMCLALAMIDRLVMASLETKARSTSESLRGSS